MKAKFKNLFLKSLIAIRWLESPGFLGMAKAGNILFGMPILVGLILYYIEGVSVILNNIIVGLLMLTMFSLFFVLSLGFYWIKPPKFIRKESENPAQLFDRFSHWSFLYGIIIYSLVASFFIGGIAVTVVKFIFKLEYDFSKLYYNLFFLTTAIFTVLYFMYHVSMKRISTKVIKARIRLYLAIITTITAGLLGLSLKEILLPLITYLGIGLAWLSYFVEKIESEI
ncbi:hypothetical protein [Guptibacillus hwajinpoensis]|uniref:Magnesium-transporting ATPase (P-type) n=1 Tax=Guptibacillus hwajinpoensis TaxID=208199 RepID=A0ABU0JVF9_9BACL|nr:hypothetical protein [Alkalihalobacillus hemicentroti]MDQ0481083.1 magnesium-transporting ATPase (P-type) [Alkalihalobacillus hemicentroti]